MSRVLIRLAAATAVLGTAAVAAPPYAYRMQVTPMDGQPDAAVERRYTPQFAACQKRARTTPDNAQCFSAEFTRQDDALNRAWRGAYGKTAAARKPALLAAQRKWVTERDPFCRRQTDGFAGGTIAPVIYGGCRVELTIRRTLWLERLGG
jgi:uncharacterized protein YecT (DUF1311 family)